MLLVALHLRANQQEPEDDDDQDQWNELDQGVTGRSCTILGHSAGDQEIHAFLTSKSFQVDARTLFCVPPIDSGVVRAEYKPEIIAQDGPQRPALAIRGAARAIFELRECHPPRLPCDQLPGPRSCRPRWPRESVSSGSGSSADCAVWRGDDRGSRCTSADA